MLVAGTALQWALGIALVLALPRRAPLLAQPGGCAWAIGVGALAGSFLLTLVMRALSLAGVSFGITSIGVPLLLLTIALGWVGLAPRTCRCTRSARRRAAYRRRRSICAAPPGSSGGCCSDGSRCASRCCWSKCWCDRSTRGTPGRSGPPRRGSGSNSKTMAPFVRSDVWFAAPGCGLHRRGSALPRHGAAADGLGQRAARPLGRRADEPAVLGAGGGLLPARYSASCASRASARSAALVGAWIVSALPLANVHVALAGYADLPLALYFALAALAGYRWSRSREWDGCDPRGALRRRLPADQDSGHRVDGRARCPASCSFSRRAWACAS